MDVKELIRTGRKLLEKTTGGKRRKWETMCQSEEIRLKGTSGKDCRIGVFANWHDNEFAVFAHNNFAQLLSEVEKQESELREAAKIGLRWMELWMQESECECDPYGHSCGRPKLLRELNQVRSALAAREAVEETE